MKSYTRLQNHLNKISRHWLYAYVLVFVFCSLIAQIIPPMQSPDENGHLMRAYAITQGHWFLAQSSHKGSGIWVDQGLLDFADGYLEGIRTPDRKPSAQEQLHLKQILWQEKTSFVPYANTGYYNPMIYIPQVIGLWLGQRGHWSISHTYQLSRFLTTLVVFAFIAWAFSLYQPNPLVIGLLILPMSLFQILMPTIDGLCHALTLLSLCWYMQLRNQDVDDRSHLMFALLLVFLITSRMHALPLLFLLLLIGPKQMHFSLRAFVIFLISVIVIAVWALWAQAHTIDLRVIRPLSSLQIIEHYLLHPQQWLSIFSNTLFQSDMWGFYGKSFIGTLGWLHLALPSWYYPSCSVVLCLLVLLSAQGLFQSPSKRKLFLFLTFLSLALLSIAIIWNLALFTWNPFPTEVIDGVQGRYFWIPACILAFGLGHSHSYAGLSKIVLGIGLIGNLYIIALVYHNAYY